MLKPACKVCGKGLKISYERSDENSNAPFVTGEPTGADIVDITLMIYPCETCMKPIHEKDAATKQLIRLLTQD